MGDTSKPRSSGPGVDLGMLRALAERVTATHGMELVDLEWVGRGRQLRVIIDRPTPTLRDGEDPSKRPAGVSIEDCVHVSRDLSALLDAEDPIAHRYELEVSSPGLERPLRGAADFARAVGKVAKVKLVRPSSDGQRVLRGQIVEATSERVRMQVDGKLHEVALADVSEACLVFEFGGQPPPRSSGKRRPKRSR